VTRGAGQPRKSAAEIEDEIRRTRAEIGLTLDALAPQLAPRQLVGKGIDMITETVRKSDLVPKDLSQAVRANRLPLAVITAGFAWLLASNLASRGGRVDSDASPGEPIPQPDSRGAIWARRAASTVGNSLPDTGSVRRTVERNPLLIGLAGLVSGAAIAALLPPTRREREWVDKTRDELWHKAEELGHEAADRVRSLAERKARAADD
jgi:Protein of unknown function (DUF3618)